MDVLAGVIAAVFAVVSPLAIAWKKNPHWSTALKTGVPILVSLVIAVLYLAYTGGFNDGVDIFTTILTVYGIQQLVYTTILKNMAEKLEWKGHEESEAGADTYTVTKAPETTISYHPNDPRHPDNMKYPDIGT